MASVSRASAAHCRRARRRELREPPRGRFRFNPSGLAGRRCGERERMVLSKELFGAPANDAEGDDPRERHLHGLGMTTWKSSTG